MTPLFLFIRLYSEHKTYMMADVKTNVTVRILDYVHITRDKIRKLPQMNFYMLI